MGTGGCRRQPGLLPSFSVFCSVYEKNLMRAAYMLYFTQQNNLSKNICHVCKDLVCITCRRHFSSQAFLPGQAGVHFSSCYSLLNKSFITGEHLHPQAFSDRVKCATIYTKSLYALCFIARVRLHTTEKQIVINTARNPYRECPLI